MPTSGSGLAVRLLSLGLFCPCGWMDTLCNFMSFDLVDSLLEDYTASGVGWLED